MAGANIGCMYEELLTNRRRAPGHSQAKLQLSGNRRSESVGTGRGGESCTIPQPHDSDGSYAPDLANGRASCWESGCHYVSHLVSAVALKKQTICDESVASCTFYSYLYSLA